MLLESLLYSSNEDLVKNDFLRKIDKRKKNISRLPGKKYKEKQEKPASSRIGSKKVRDTTISIKEVSKIKISLVNNLES